MEARARDDRWTLGTAVRLERFEDFGTTANWKLAARYGLAGALAVRGSASTGFRGPTPGQQNAFNVSTQFDPTLRELVNNGTIPSTSPVAAFKGGGPLDAEKSANASGGVVVDAGSFSLSADYFRVALSDRLALSQVFALTAAEAEQLISTRWTAAARRSLGTLSLLGRLSYYAGWFDSRDDRSYPGEHLVDLEASYALSGSSTLACGAQNALNRYPEENPNARAVAGNLYSPATPFGSSGGFYYVKAGFSW